MPPPSPPMLDDILSQMSQTQRDFSSTQLFRSNSEYFNNSRKNTPTNVAANRSSFDQRGSSFQGSFSSQLSQTHNDWFTSGSQPSLTQSRYTQPLLLTEEDDEAAYGAEQFIQDSRELFTQRSDLHVGGGPLATSELEDMENSEGMSAKLS